MKRKLILLASLCVFTCLANARGTGAGCEGRRLLGLKARIGGSRLQHAGASRSQKTELRWPRSRERQKPYASQLT